MNKKIIFFDIDGTIIAEKSKKILDSTIQAIKAARENGHLAVINTGRTEFLIGKDLKEDIVFDGYLLGCGTAVIFEGKEQMHCTLAASLIDELVSELRACNIDGVLEGKTMVYIDRPENIHTEVFKKFLDGIKADHDYWDAADKKVDKLFTYMSDKSDKERFRNKFSQYFDFIDREHGFWEILPTGHSKASGIQYLVDYLGLSMEDTVAIGDSNNDISMLSYVNTSIAMGNANQRVKDMSSFVTTKVDEDGIWNALKWLDVI